MYAQGSLGTCGFLASLGAVAKASPQTIYNLFTSNGDGTYSVRFFHNGAPQYVTVNQMLPADSHGVAAYAAWDGVDVTGHYLVQSPNFASYFNNLWVALVEKAYAQLNESGWTGLDGTNTYNALDQGVYPQNALTQITGQTASDMQYISSTIHGKSSESDLLALLNAGKAITIVSNFDHADSSIVLGHAYIVTGYNPANHTFQLYNPWGVENTDTVHSTQINISWNGIYTSFYYWNSVLPSA